MKAYRKKPVVINAWQLLNDNEIPSEILTQMKLGKIQLKFQEKVFSETPERKILIHTLEGVMLASENDFIIKGVNGEFYPCKPEIFEKSYEMVDQENEHTLKSESHNLHDANFSFGAILNFLKAGYKVARKGWNGKNQFVFMTPGRTLDLTKDNIWTEHMRKQAEANGGLLEVQPYLSLMNAQGKDQIGWVPSMGDLFANDWVIIN